MHTGTWNMVKAASDGRTVRQIAEATDLSPRTVRTYLYALVERGEVREAGHAMTQGNPMRYERVGD